MREALPGVWVFSPPVRRSWALRASAPELRRLGREPGVGSGVRVCGVDAFLEFSRVVVAVAIPSLPMKLSQEPSKT